MITDCKIISNERVNKQDKIFQKIIYTGKQGAFNFTFEQYYWVKDKKAYLYIISNKDGIIRVLNLVNGKLRTLNKFNQVVNYILSHSIYCNLNITFVLESSNNLQNH